MKIARERGGEWLRRERQYLGRLAVAAGLVLLCDVVTKSGVGWLAARGRWSGEIFLNQGVSFGVDLLGGAGEVWLVGAVLLLVAGLGIWQKLSAWGLGLYLGGGMANLIDRIWDGAVTDWLLVPGTGGVWSQGMVEAAGAAESWWARWLQWSSVPVQNNLADWSVSIGVVWLVGAMVWDGWREERDVR